MELLHFSHFHHVSLVQWTNHLLPTTEGSDLRPGVQPALGTGITCQRCLATMVTLTWSLITGYNRSSLLAIFVATLDTLLVPVVFLWQATDYGDILLGSCKAHTYYLGGGGSPVELLHFAHYHHVSLVQWTNRLLPPQGAVVCAQGVHPALWNWDYLLAHLAIKEAIGETGTLLLYNVICVSEYNNIMFCRANSIESHKALYFQWARPSASHSQVKHIAPPCSCLLLPPALPLPSNQQRRWSALSCITSFLRLQYRRHILIISLNCHLDTIYLYRTARKKSYFILLFYLLFLFHYHENGSKKLNSWWWCTPRMVYF